MIYFGTFFVLLLLSLGEVVLRIYGKTIKERKTIYVVVFCFLALFAGLRENTGLDYNSYSRYYDLFQSGAVTLFNRVFEVGYSIINLLAPSFRVLIFFMACSSLYVKHKVFDRLNIRCLATILLYYYASLFLFYDMGVMRQGLSIGIAWMAIPLIPKRDKRFFVYILIAALFHVSSLVFILLYFLADREYSRWFYYGIALVSVAIYTLEVNTSFMGNLISNIGISFIQNKFDVYSAYGEVSLTWSILKRLFLLVLFVELFKKKTISFNGRHIGHKEKTPFTWIYINSVFLSTVLLCVLPAAGLSYVAGRMTMVLYAVHIFLYEEVVASSKSKGTTLLWFAVFLVLSYMSFSETLLGSAGNTYLPYKSIFG